MAVDMHKTCLLHMIAELCQYIVLIGNIIVIDIMQ